MKIPSLGILSSLCSLEQERRSFVEYSQRKISTYSWEDIIITYYGFLYKCSSQTQT